MSYGPESIASRTALGAAAALAMVLASTIGLLAQKVELDVVFVPTPADVVNRMLQLAQVKPGEYVIDLGSGDGRILVAAAKNFGARGFGVDIDPERVAEARENAKREGVTDKVTFEIRNLYETDFSKADVLTMYLRPEINLNLRPKILDLRPGTRVVSHAFDMADWKPDEEDDVRGRNVYLWIVPAKIGGRWQVQSGERRLQLDLRQQYQQVTGSAQVNGRSVPVQDARLKGEEFSFVLDIDGKKQTFRGRIKGDAIEGQDAGGGSWRGTRAAT